MSKNRLDEILSKEIRGAKTPSVQDAVAMLMGNNKRSIAKPVKKYTGKEKSDRITKLKAKRDGVEEPEHIPEIDHIPEIPEGFPEGTILNDDQTLTLPDGRMIRKIKEVNHEEVS